MVRFIFWNQWGGPTKVHDALTSESMLLVAAAASAWMGFTGYPGALLRLDGRGVNVAANAGDFAGQGQVPLRIVPRDHVGGKRKQ
eukprot:4718645-Alexandrium_andersonii.AAC.1